MTTDALIIKGDCLNVMAGLPAASIDAIVTDPPYGLSFMGKDWDKGVPGESFWREALRVAKPGCHILAAGGSRTYHRLTCAIEDAGWEIRDCVMWIYGSGFPKSHDVSKAIDREAGAEREVLGINPNFCKNRVDSIGTANGIYGGAGPDNGKFITAPATEAAKQWQGWGTALKPAFEPFILARKPLDGTVAENVQKHGCGGLNVDGCRVGSDETTVRKNNARTNGSGWGMGKHAHVNGSDLGRWPANVIHDGSDEVVRVFPETHAAGTYREGSRAGNTFNKRQDSGKDKQRPAIDNGGSASRFFYCAKASASERDEGCEGLALVTHQSGMGGAMPVDDDGNARDRFKAQSRNHHPTVKPVDLMKYLCRLITPPGGLILDPFCGSGSTGVAAMREGFNFIGIELNADYAEIARRRIDHERNKTPLFSNVI